MQKVFGRLKSRQSVLSSNERHMAFLTKGALLPLRMLFRPYSVKIFSFRVFEAFDPKRVLNTLTL